MKYGQWMAAFALVAAVGLSSAAAGAASSPAVTLTIRHQAFTPQNLTVPAGQKVELMVSNQDAAPAEFESDDLGREKVIPGGSRLPIYVGPLKPGRYRFFNDFHPASTGTLTAVAPKR